MPLRTVFMGTAPFAVPSLEALLRAGHLVSAVVTQPDRPQGRGRQLRPSAVRTAALDAGIAVLQPEKASAPDFVAELRALEPELIVVVAYGQILRPAVLDLPPLGCVNVHGSLLPELRGAAPIQWSVINGDRETGVTTMFMDPGMDTGDIILQATEPIHPTDTAGALGERLAPLGADLLLESLRLIEAGDAPRNPQNGEHATYAPMLKRDDGAVHWSDAAFSIRNRIHGCNPAPGAFALRAGAVVKIWRAELVEQAATGAPGEVVELTAEGPVLATGTRALRILEAQPESRARTTGAELARGLRMVTGERWESGPTTSQ